MVKKISKNNKLATPNQPTKFKKKNWVKINDESRGTSNSNSQINFKTSILRSSLCDDSSSRWRK